MDFLVEWAEKTELPVVTLLDWLGVHKGKFYAWRKRYGQENAHNGKMPREHWIEKWERDAIVAYHDKHPLNGYRRLSFMMLDDDDCDVAVSPSTTYRVLREAGVIDRWHPGPSKKGTGFAQPSAPHKHWHVDIAYLNVAGTFYYLCSVLDGYSRFILHHEIRESMKESDVELVLQRAKEKFPDEKPRIITDNGPQFVARDFKVFIREAGMTHVRTAPYYPQSNGKIERWHKTMKVTTIRPKSPASLEEARRVVERFVRHYNERRLHSAIGYVTPADKLAGREEKIWAARDAKLEAARERRRARRQRAREAA